ncbi:MAG: acyltransferase [Oscillospiraceae bacterium]|nr:acyltransferase [Oscillospiraceae bacterium]
MDRSEKLVTQRESTAFYCMKCFAILCVIAAHVNQYCDNSVLESVATRAWSHIAKYGVACFFILGGFFYQRTEHDGKRFWAKKFQTLVVPWVFCASLTFLITRRWVTEGNYFALPLNQILRDYLVWVSGYGTIYYFAAVFLFCQLVFKFLAKKDIYLYITVLASAAALILHEMGLSGGVDQLFLKDQLNPLYRMGLFSLGVLARKHRIDRALLQQKRLILLPLLILAVTTPYLFTGNETSSFDPVCVLDSVAFCAVFYVVCYWLAGKKVSRWLVPVGRSTYCIYLLHLEIVLIVADRLPYSVFKTVMLPVICLGVMAALVQAGKWVCKFLPFGEKIKGLVGL